MKKLFLICILSFYGFSNSYAQTKLIFHKLPDMPTALGAIASATDGKCFYICNGFTKKSNFSSLIEKYDIAQGKWTEYTRSLVQKQFATAAIVGNELYLFNGDLSNSTINKKVEVLNLSTGEIKFTTENPHPAHGAGVAVWKGIIYSFGGNLALDKKFYSNGLFKFDPQEQKWTMLANMFEAKETKGVVVDGKLYIIGGFYGEVSDKIEMYDIDTDKWSTLMKMPKGISANSVVADGSKIYTLFDFNDQKFVGCYDIPANTFTVVKQKKMKGRRHAGAHVVDGKLYIMGGNTEHSLASCIPSLQCAELK